MLFFKILQTKYNKDFFSVMDDLKLAPQITVLQGQIDDLESQISTLNAQISALSAQLFVVNGQISVNESQLDSVNATITRISAQIDAVNASISTAQALIASKQDLITSTQATINDITNNQIPDAEENVEYWKFVRLVYISKFPNKDPDMNQEVLTAGTYGLDLDGIGIAFSVKQSVSGIDINNARTQANNSLSELISTRTLLQNNLVQYNASITQAQTTIDTVLIPQKTALESQLQTALTQKSSLEATIAALSQQKADLEAKIAAKQDDVDELEAQLPSLEAQLQAMKAKLAQATQLFDGLTHFEKDFLRELFPEISFPV